MVVMSPLMPDGDAVALGLWQRRVASETVAVAAQQRADVAGVGGLGGFKLARDAPGEARHIRAAERGEGNFPVRAVNRHRLQRRLLGQRGRDGAREAMPGLAVGRGTIFWRCVHVRLMDSTPRGVARRKRRERLQIRRLRRLRRFLFPIRIIREICGQNFAATIWLARGFTF